MTKFYEQLFGVSALILLQYTKYSETLTIKVERWKFPCANSKVVTNSIHALQMAPIVVPVHEVYKSLREHSKLLNSELSTLKTQYEMGRITGAQLKRFLDGQMIAGLPSPDEYRNMESFNFTRELLQDYEILSRFAVFLEQIMSEEMEYNYDELHLLMKTVEREIYTLLCDLHTTLKTVVNVHYISYVERDIMSNSLKYFRQRSIRYQRDYIIINLALKWSATITGKYRQRIDLLIV